MATAPLCRFQVSSEPEINPSGLRKPGISLYMLTYRGPYNKPYILLYMMRAHAALNACHYSLDQGLATVANVVVKEA